MTSEEAAQMLKHAAEHLQKNFPVSTRRDLISRAMSITILAVARERVLGKKTFLVIDGALAKTKVSGG
jgi:hypothetical protein